MGDPESPAGPRARAVEATLAIIAEHGIPALADRSRLALAAGLDPVDLDELFPDDGRQLLRAALRHRVEGQVERFGTLAAGMRRNPPYPERAAAAMEGVIWSALDRAEEIAELEIHLQAARDPALQEDTRRAFAAYEDFAATVLAALGLPDDPQSSRVAVTLFTGFAVRRLSTGERDARQGIFEALMILVRGLGTEPPS